MQIKRMVKKIRANCSFNTSGHVCGFFFKELKFLTKKTWNCFAYLILLWFAYVKKKRTGLNAKHCRLVVNETNHCYFMGWFPNAKNKPNWLSFAIHGISARSGILLTTFSLKKETKKRTKKRIIVDLWFLTSWTMTSENCTRAHVQQNKSIYLSIYFSVWKRFWKWVYKYIYLV